MITRLLNIRFLNSNTCFVISQLQTGVSRHHRAFHQPVKASVYLRPINNRKVSTSLRLHRPGGGKKQDNQHVHQHSLTKSGAKSNVRKFNPETQDASKLYSALEKLQKDHENAASTKVKASVKSLYGRFKDMAKKYWYVLVPVHLVTSAVWFGGLYYLASR